MSLQCGDTIGDYLIIWELGVGGMGKVFQVRNLISDRIEALKVLLPDLQNNQELVNRFLREIKVHASLVHPNIAVLYTATCVSNQLLMFIEMIDGETLAEKIKAGPLEARDGVNYMGQMLLALSYAHERGVIHRDIKPSNIMVTPTGGVKLMDFGIARGDTDHKLTSTGTALGSLYYMSPEQVKGSEPDCRSDLYSAGVAAYEILTGKRPFDGDTEYTIMTAHVMNEPEAPHKLNPNLPPALSPVILKALAKNSAERFQTAEEFRLALIAALDVAPEITAPITPSDRKVFRPSSGMIFLSLSLLVLITVIAYLLIRPKPLPSLLTFEKSGDMRLVPAGPALLGADKHRMYLAAFYIDKTEVSNGAYSRFLKEKGYKKPLDFPENRPGDPVVNVSYDDANAFASWAGKRLPSEVEWEKAARGEGGRAYPWGDQKNSSLANLNDNPDLPRGHRVTPVTGFQAGASPYGALNMCGNVWEWVNTKRAPEDEILKHLQSETGRGDTLTKNDMFFEIKGGAFDVGPLSPDLITDFSVFPAKLASRNIGFRCAKTAAAK
jgi:serine/threonine protein kinase